MSGHPRRAVLVIAVLAVAGWFVSWALNSGWLAIATTAIFSLVLAFLIAETLVRQARLDRHHNRTVGYVWGLTGLVTAEHQVFPALDESSLSVEASYQLARIVGERRPRTILELGPGVSTLILHLARRASEVQATIHCVEHDSTYVERLQDLIDRFGIDDCIVHLAPLEEQSSVGWSGRWYRRDFITELPDQIDLLVVDGPPNYSGDDDRYPALPTVMGRLTRAATVFVDDTDRPSEQAMLQRWVDQEGLSVEFVGDDFTVLRVP